MSGASDGLCPRLHVGLSPLVTRVPSPLWGKNLQKLKSFFLP